jgi:ubiquinone/menaquinone biosynthesis C-methylase UbiE
MNALCLQCGKQLPLRTDETSGDYTCACGCTIPYSHGIYRFAEKNDFYEGKFVETQISDTFRRRFARLIRTALSIDGSEERMWRKGLRYIRKYRSDYGALQVLNVGCGGGHAFLKALGTVTSVDISTQSLVHARHVCDYCYQADAGRLPFADESFDAVFSAHLLGHIPLDKKQAVIKEIYRVTKKGGFSLHSAECEADNLIYRKAKKYPALYRKYFQEKYGHYGIELPALCKKRFRDESFTPVYEISDYCKGFVRPAPSYDDFFGAKEFSEKEMLFFVLAFISKILSANSLTSFVAGIFLYPWTLLNRIGGPDSVDSVKLLYRK